MSRPSCSRWKFRQTQGFTLVEILVAISILAIVLTSIYGVFSAVSRAGDRLDRDSADYHLARVVFDRLGRELHGAYYRPEDETTRLRGGLDAQGSPYLEFATTAVTPASPTGTGVATVRYNLVPTPEEDAGGHTLMRGEFPRKRQIATQEPYRMMRLAPALTALTFRFYRDGNWLDRWDSSTDGLPQLVEINLVTGIETHRQNRFVSAFRLPETTP